MINDNIGVFSWFGYIMPLEERLNIIKSSGFNAVAIWWEDEEGENIIKKEKIPKLVKMTGLFIENIHAPFCEINNLWNENECLRKEIVEMHIQWIKDCSEYDIPVMVMHVSQDFKINEPNSSGLQSMREIVKAAEEYGIKVAIENTDNNDLITYLLDNISSQSLGLCFDTSHNRISINNEINLLKKYGSRLFATHISDNDGLKDRHWIPLDGSISWESFGEDFPRDYAGCFSLEICAGEKDKSLTPEEYMMKAYKRVMELKSLLK